MEQKELLLIAARNAQQYSSLEDSFEVTYKAKHNLTM